MKAINVSQNIVIVDSLEIANSVWSRMKGLLGRDSLPNGSGLLITQCNSIHMFFMRFPLDILFLDNSNQVVGLIKNIPPFAISPIFWKATKVIEVAVGTIEKSGTKLGDMINCA